jgi:hypothetical protein
VSPGLPIVLERLFLGLNEGVHEEDAEFVSKALIVRFLLVFELLGILEEFAKSLGELFAEDFLDRLKLSLKNVGILLELICPADALPGQVTSQELDDHVSN